MLILSRRPNKSGRIHLPQGHGPLQYLLPGQNEKATQAQPGLLPRRRRPLAASSFTTSCRKECSSFLVQEPTPFWWQRWLPLLQRCVCGLHLFDCFLTADLFCQGRATLGLLLLVSGLQHPLVCWSSPETSQLLQAATSAAAAVMSAAQQLHARRSGQQVCKRSCQTSALRIGGSTARLP